MNVKTMQQKRAAGENGFTLIELLVVVVIIGILIAIAIPLYLNYTKGANDKATQSDVRNAVNVMELCNTSNGTYPAGMDNKGGTPKGCEDQTVTASEGTEFDYRPGKTTFVLVATNADGNNKFYCYNSEKGGSVTAVDPTPVNMNNASC